MYVPHLSVCVCLFACLSIYFFSGGPDLKNNNKQTDQKQQHKFMPLS